MKQEMTAERRGTFVAFLISMGQQKRRTHSTLDKRAEVPDDFNHWKWNSIGG
jgi:hypothetical protein